MPLTALPMSVTSSVTPQRTTGAPGHSPSASTKSRCWRLYHPRAIRCASSASTTSRSVIVRVAGAKAEAESSAPPYVKFLARAPRRSENQFFALHVPAADLDLFSLGDGPQPWRKADQLAPI